MFLNLYILKDYLKIRTLAYRLSDNKNLCTLSDVSLFRQDSPLHPDILYVISSPASIQTLPHSCSGNFLFTRQTDTVFLPPEGNYLITDTADPLELLQQAQDVFQKFRRWELDLYALQNNHASLKALARTGIPFLENPLCLYTPNLRALFFLNNRPANCRPDYYFGDREGEYMSAEYANRLRFDPDYLETMHTSEPSVYSAGVFGYRTLYYNIYTDGVYIARLVLCEVFRPIRDSDFPLLKFLASFLRTSLEQQSIPVNSHPPYFDYCLTELIHNRAPEAERMNHAFEDYGWNQKDRYFCMYIPVSETEITAYTVLTFCSRLETSYIGSAAVTMDSCILFWINLTRLDMSFETAAASASALIGNYSFQAGISSEFCNLSDSRSHFLQARTAYELGSRENPGISGYYFEEYRLSDILSLLETQYSLSSLCPAELLRLMRYDALHHTSFSVSLKKYLENSMSIARTCQELYIHRATLIYQLKRIREISGLDLSSGSRRLYLLLFFRLLDRNGISPSEFTEILQPQAERVQS